ncbi:MAG: TonB-dependent receptor [Bacteroidetes bacterium]|nr:TonB-dependent receptor [Bacteroidota bacterium]
MIKNAKFIFSTLLLGALKIYAQTGYIKGTVKDQATQETLPGAIVSIDSKTGVSTDIEGNYMLAAPAGSYTLECRVVGYTNSKMPVTIASGDTLKLDILLKNANQLLNEVVVSAGRFEQKLSDVTVSMEVIKPALIENKNTTSLDIIMNQVPGVIVSDGQASIRGGSGYSYGAGSRVLMLVDEMPMISADAGDIKWNYIPLENMEQVEVIKGAASAMFGSSALNGVINMRTAYAKDKPMTSVTSFFGSYDAPRRSSLKWWRGSSQNQSGINFSHAEKIGRFDLVLGGHMYNDEGYRYLETEKRQRFNANIRYNFKKARGLVMGVNTNMMNTRGGLFFLWQNADSAYIPQGYTIQRYNNQRFNIDPYINYFFKSGGKISLRTRYFLTNNTNDTHQGSRAELYYSELQYQKRFRKEFTITAGAVYMEQVVIADSLYGKHSGRNIAGYVQLDKKFGKLTASVGLRGEYYRVDTAYTRGYINSKINNLPFQPVFRAGLNYHALEYTFIRASFGQGYRFPSIAEKFVNTSVGSSLKIYPNSALQPERGWSAEVGIKQGFGIGGFKGFLDVAGFWTEYTNMVEFVFDIYGPKTGLFYLDKNYAGFKSQNVGHGTINGLDVTLTGTGKIGPVNVSLLAGYTYMNPINPNYNPAKDTLGLPGLKVLKYRNRHLFKNDIQLDYKKFSLGFSTRYYSPIENIDRRFTQSVLHEYNTPDVNWDNAPSTYILPGLKEYRAAHTKGDWIHDLRMSCQVTKIVKVSFIVNNVFNAEYTLRPGDVRPPRMFIGQLNFRF